MSPPSKTDLLRQHWPFAAVLAIAAVMIVAMLAMTGGHPTYSLDDAWIHLQFSEQIVAGHFGLVSGIKASPSSSILYPLLLTPLAGTSLHAWQPAIWNLAGLLMVTALWRRLFDHFVLADLDPRPRQLAAGLASVALVLLTSMFWLASTGMEHTLQVAAAIAVAIGLIELLETGKARWWLLVGLVAGPLLRLENFSITLPAVGVLFWRGHWRLALIATVGSIGGVALHGIISNAAGLPFVGGPVLVKSAITDWLDAPLHEFSWQIMNLARSLRAGRADSGNIVLGGALAIVLFWRWRRGGDPTAAWLAAIALSSLAAQLFFGNSLWPGRHEIYTQCFALAALIFALRHRLSETAARWGAIGATASGAVLLASLFPAALIWTAAYPWAAQDIWRQQWQMRRFLLEHLKAPVAVNDVGLTAYRNPYLVLDLVGLGSEEVRRDRLEGRATPQATAALFAKHRIEVAIIYDRWVGDRMPPTVERVAEFHLGRFPVSVAGATVAVYATSKDAAAKVRQAAREFAPSMPPGSRLVVLPER